jgi:VWFA-related protein
MKLPSGNLRFAVAMLLLASVIALDGFAGAKSLRAANPEQTQVRSQFSVEAPLVNVNVLVTDSEGRVISGLKPGNFRVLDNGVPQTITGFASTAAPITIVLLLEYSSSAYNYYAAKSASWAAGFLNELEPRDWVALVTYDLHSTVRVDFTHNLASVRDGIGSLGYPSFNEMGLYDALLETLDKLEPVRGRKSILLLSTGANTLGAATLADVMKRLKTTDVTIFSIALAEQEYIRSSASDVGYLQARASLQTYSDLTGGIAFFPRFPAEMPEISESVSGFLRNEYTLSFTPPKDLRDGKPHRLSVEAIGADGKPLTSRDKKGRERKLTVFARSGYKAPLGTASAAPQGSAH